MKFKIDFDIPKKELPQKWPRFFMMGSCFAANQSIRFIDNAFSVYQNPFGIIYNPVSIANLMYRISEQKLYEEPDFMHTDKFFNLEHHGNFKYDSISKAVSNSNNVLNEAKRQLSDANVVVLTLGTSLVFHHLERKKIVANCHKLPGKEFDRIQLKYKTIKNSISNSINAIRKVNSDAHIVFTVSPIRHLRSGVIENKRSKSILIAALHSVLEETKNMSYFPSYEIFTDELRDYRFVKEDLVHPTEQAEDYIWQRFADTYFNATTHQIIKEVQNFKRFAGHRPMTSESTHAAQVAEKKQQLNQKYSFLNLT